MTGELLLERTGWIKAAVGQALGSGLGENAAANR